MERETIERLSDYIDLIVDIIEAVLMTSPFALALFVLLLLGAR